MDITMDIYKMEKITAYVNHKLELFVSRWDNWVNYVTPHRPDFIFTNLWLYDNDKITPSLFVL